jgi:hypothetical protein
MGTALNHFVQNGIAEQVVTGLPSLALNGTDASGAHDIAFDANGEAYVVVGLGGSASDRNNNLIPAHDNAQFFGNLLAIDALDGGSSWTALADLAAYEAANNPDSGMTPGGTPELISNPYALSIQNDKAFVVDAGANDLLEVTLGTDESDSDIALKSVFSPRLVPNPTPQGPDPFPMQSVPTSIATDADGTFFVGELTGFPFPQDEARIYRLDANNQPQVYADGFTNIIDFAFDRDRNLYVLEYATNSLLSGDLTGALIRVAPDGTRTTIASEELLAPTALALDSDGDVYVSNRGFVAGEGEVLRISAVPEPASVLGLLAFGAGGTVWQLWRKRQLG